MRVLGEMAPFEYVPPHVPFADRADSQKSPHCQYGYRKFLHIFSTNGKALVFHTPGKGVNEPTTAKYLFGLTPESLSNQNSLLFPSDKDPDIKVSLEKVGWNLLSSATTEGFPFSETTPTIKVSRPLPGNYFLSAVGDFSAIPHETSIPVNGGVGAPKGAFAVKGEFLAWEVIPDKPDHLERIAIVTSADTWNELYEKNGHWVWRKKNGLVETQSMAVGISSELILKPIINHRLEEMTFKWFDETGEMIQFGHAHIFESGATIKTPEKIGLYKLVLEVPGLDLFEIPDVFALHSIVPASNFGKIYFLNCIKTSVLALEGMSILDSPKELVSRFNNWWWKKIESKHPNKFVYYKNAITTSDVFPLGGGVCRGLGNYFYKALELQGVPGEATDNPNLGKLKRIGFLMSPVSGNKKSLIVSDWLSKEELPYDPVKSEYFGGIIILDPGLGNSIPQDVFPKPAAKTIYKRVPIQIPIGINSNKRLPPDDFSDLSQLILINSGSIDTISSKESYIFSIGRDSAIDNPQNPQKLYSDGHAFVVWEEKNSWEIFDPSFGRGNETVSEKISLDPQSQDVIIVNYGGSVVFPGFVQYLKNRIAFFRSFTPCIIASTGLQENKIIDSKWENLNFLRLRFISYDSTEDGKKKTTSQYLDSLSWSKTNRNAKASFWRLLEMLGDPGLTLEKISAQISEQDLLSNLPIYPLTTFNDPPFGEGIDTKDFSPFLIKKTLLRRSPIYRGEKKIPFFKGRFLWKSNPFEEIGILQFFHYVVLCRITSSNDLRFKAEVQQLDDYLSSEAVKHNRSQYLFSIRWEKLLRQTITRYLDLCNTGMSAAQK